MIDNSQTGQLKKVKKTVKVNSVRQASQTLAGAQTGAHVLIPGVTHDLCGAEHMASVLAVVPPGKPTKVHFHPTSETILFILEGLVATLVGPKLKPVFHGPGDFVFIPENTIHIGVNLSSTHRAVVIETRSHKHFTHDVHLLPELEAKAQKVIDKLLKQFNEGTLPLGNNWQQLVGKSFQFPT